MAPLRIDVKRPLFYALLEYDPSFFLTRAPSTAPVTAKSVHSSPTYSPVRVVQSLPIFPITRSAMSQTSRLTQSENRCISPPPPTVYSPPSSVRFCVPVFFCEVSRLLLAAVRCVSSNHAVTFSCSIFLRLNPGVPYLLGRLIPYIRTLECILPFSLSPLLYPHSILLPLPLCTCGADFA